MKRDLSFLNKRIIRRIKRWIIESSKWNCPFIYQLPSFRLFGFKSKRRCHYCEKIFPGIKGRQNPKTTIRNCPCGHYEYKYVKRIAELIITKEISSRN